MYKRKQSKVITCIFCGTKLTKKNSSIEHIIPKSILPSNKLVVREMCRKCNNLLGKITEQPAIPFLKEIMASLIVEGFPIKFGRRKKRSKYIKQFDKGIAILPFGNKKEVIPCIMGIDTEKKNKFISFEPSWVNKSNLNFSKLTEDKYRVIFPVSENEGMKELQLFCYKIIFELSFLLWKKKFLNSESAKYLKTIILGEINKIPTAEILDLNNPLICWDKEELERGKYIKINGNKKKKTEESISQISPFDNPPHITFSIVNIKNIKWMVILNLFGRFETTIRLFENDKEIGHVLEETQGLVMVIKLTGSKELLKFSYDEYIVWKMIN